VNVKKTNSQFFVLRHGTDKWTELQQPTSMDEDCMPKDRMAVLGDPENDSMMYVAGNAGALAWRVDLKSGKWTKMWDKPDVADGSLPHGDCRNYAWDDSSSRLLLVSDGGIFARHSPREAGGRWVSLNGNYGSMEYLSAHYDNRLRRFVAGAQDNSAQYTLPNSSSASVAVGFVGGDGTVTAVDNVHNPARLFGTTQFMGVGAIDIDPSDSEEDRGSDAEVRRSEGGDSDCDGFCYMEGDIMINVPLTKYFPEPSSFPYFVMPYALNTQNPSEMIFWTNGTAKRNSAFYKFVIGDDVKHGSDIPPPELVLETPDGCFFLDFIAGGYTKGSSDDKLLVGISNENLYIASSETGHKLVTRPLPKKFAIPVIMDYDQDDHGSRILGPVTHGATVSMTVSPSNSRVIAVTGWHSVDHNDAREEVWVTFDAGLTWKNVTGDLRRATGVHGLVRPSGLLIVDMLENHAHALLVGTSTGVMVTYLEISSQTQSRNMESEFRWRRLGAESEFPLVKAAGLSYEHYSDKLVSATFGRGIYSIGNAKETLLDLYYESYNKVGKGRVIEESSAKFFPPQA